MSLILTSISSLEKVFSDTKPCAQVFPLSLLKNDQLSFQLAVFSDAPGSARRTDYKVLLDSPLADRITLRSVENVPVHRTAVLIPVKVANSHYLTGATMLSQALFD